MQTITKKRLKAYFIDFAIASVVTLGIESILRKKIKSEVFYIIVTPVVIPFSLEYLQLKRRGQTVGYKASGLILQSKDATPLTSNQVIKRTFYSQLVSPFKYLAHPRKYWKSDGQILPHDRVANTIVSEAD